MIQKVGIIGGGISGLSSYYYLRNGINILSNSNKQIKINMFEKSNKLGGNIQTNIHSNNGGESSKNIVVEEGPRSLRAAGRGLNTLELVKRLGMSNEIIFSSKNSNGKFLLLDGKIQEIPMSSLPKILYFSLKYGLFKAILKEPFQKIPKPVKEQDPNWDESIFDFFSRRLGKKVAQTFVEPMVLGIHGGDYKKLSIKSCFPGVARVEAFNGLLLGSIFNKSKKQLEMKAEIEKQEKHLIPSKSSLTDLFDRDIDGTGVFSFKENGLSKLILQIKKLIDNDFNTKLFLSTTINEIQKDGPSIKVIDSNGSIHHYDQLISTIPFTQLAPMFKKSDPILYNLLESMNYTSIAVVNLIYKSDNKVFNSIKDKGFGYLVASREGEQVIGVCFDSNTFPEFVNNNSTTTNQEKQSIITIMIGGNKGIKERNDKWVDVVNESKESLLKIANKHLEKHLDIESKPDIVNVKVYENGIPHYQIGHKNLLNQIQQHISKNYGNSLLLGGNSVDGVGINDAIFKSKQIVQSLKFK